MKPDRDDILKLFRRSKRNSLSLRELMAMASLSPGSKRLLQGVLRDLVRQGLLSRIRGGRYRLARPQEMPEGIVSLNRRGDGYVNREDGQDVRIPARHLDGAVDGDRVRYVLLRRDRMNRLNGRVVEILSRSAKLLVGMFQPGRDDHFLLPVDSSFSHPIPLDRRLPTGIRPGDWVVVKPDKCLTQGKMARGEVVDILGSADDPLVEMKASACRHDFPLHFPAPVIVAAAAIKDDLSPDDMAGRTDLRHLSFVTIDGDSARDFDDAVTVVKNGDGYRLYVAIADVGHYVKESDVVDQCAYQRGTSVYFPAFCLPMLPEKLSNHLCSLKPGDDRLVMVAELSFSRKGERTGASFYAAIIKSRRRLTYDEVERFLEEALPASPPGDDEALSQLKVMHRLSRLLTSARRQRGSLELDVPEAEFVLDASGRPGQIRYAERLESHRLIEEFMLAANEAVAAFLADRGYDLPYRVHEAPDPADFGALNNYLAAQTGQKLVFNHDLHEDLQKMVRSIEEEAQKRIVSKLLLRCLKQAYYSVENVGHYGLAADRYCHFTSPIRRYPDLMVHRILKKCLAGSQSSTDKGALATMAEHCSRRERLAVDAERDVQALLACRFMEDQIGKTFSGTVSSVMKFGFFVELRQFPVEGLVHLSMMTDDYYLHDAEQGRLIGERTGRIIAVGKAVKISVENVNIARREIDFALMSGHRDEKQGRSENDRRRKR